MFKNTVQQLRKIKNLYGVRRTAEMMRKQGYTCEAAVQVLATKRPLSLIK